MRLANIKQAFRHGQVRQRIMERVNRLGVNLQLSYLFIEGDRDVGPAAESARFAAYEVAELRPQHIPEMVEAMPWTNAAQFERSFADGQVCIGVREHDRLVAYAWANLRECNYEGMPFRLNANEAYLYGAYTCEDYRGRGLAPFIRAQTYALLRRQGRQVFYSVSDYFNAPAIRFKEKLDARRARLGLSVRFGARPWHHFTLRNYEALPARESA